MLLSTDTPCCSRTDERSNLLKFEPVGATTKVEPQQRLKEPSSTRRPTVTRVGIFLFLLVTVAALIEVVDAKVYVVKNRNSTKPCKVHRNRALHEVMDRICLMCHEMFSHIKPNMRSDCRQNCFKTEHFRKCLNVFNPQEAERLWTNVLS